ncbi:MAG: peptidyl-prolyl cis-trans isomerase [Armatimonadetes bacterium]|nr:peptidyl-prolyl cis-trans isomerase [Armatimonadota bacterium]
MKKILMMAVWLGLALASHGADIDPAKTVLVINGEEVKAQEYYSRMETLADVGRVVNNTIQPMAPGLLTLQRLIEERLLLQLAKEKNVAPTAQQVKDLIELKKERDPAFVDDWLKLGLPMADLEYQASVEVAQFNLMTMGITITNQEVETYYKGNTREFTSPKKLKLSMIAVKTADKDKADAALKSGKSFADVAREMSVDTSKSAGGAIGEVDVEMFAEPVKKQLEAVKIGQTTEWIPGKEIVVKFLKENVIPAKVQPLDDHTKYKIRRNLMLDRGLAKNNLEQMLKELRKRSKIEMLLPVFKTDFQKFLDQAGFGANPSQD